MTHKHKLVFLQITPLLIRSDLSITSSFEEDFVSYIHIFKEQIFAFYRKGQYVYAHQRDSSTFFSTFFSLTWFVMLFKTKTEQPSGVSPFQEGACFTTRDVPCQLRF